MKKIALIFVVLLNCAVVYAAGVTVSNVRIEDLGGGLLEVFYDISSSSSNRVKVSMEVSDDRGVTYDVDARDFAYGSDIGYGVTPGRDRRIIWNAKSDWSGQETYGLRVRLTADIESLEPSKGLVSHYPFDGDVVDYSTARNDGVDARNIDFGSGVDGEAIELSGNSFLAFSEPLSEYEKLTIAMWVKVRSSASSQIFAAYCGPDGDTGLSVGYYNGEINFNVGHESSCSNRGDKTTVSVPASLNEWHHIAAEFSASNHVVLFLDGVRVDEVTTGVPSSYTSRPLYLGTDPRSVGSNYNLDGCIDDLRIYNRVLNDGEIAVLAGKILNDDGPTPDGFSLIPAGTFLMGSPDGELGRGSDEIQHQVTFSRDFYIGQTEVTWAQWNAVRDEATARGYSDISAGRNGYNGDSSGEHPVTEVSWWDVIKWCNLRSELEGLTPVYYTAASFGSDSVFKMGTSTPYPDWSANGYRLPTEAEWEYACRAGTETAFYTGDIASETGTDPNLDRAGWYWRNSGSNTHPVGEKEANAWELYDMHGNVWEWCWDWDGAYEGSETDPKGAASGDNRVPRGGNWGGGAHYCRSANRNWAPPSYKYNNLGFRIARTPSP